MKPTKLTCRKAHRWHELCSVRWSGLPGEDADDCPLCSAELWERKHLETLNRIWELLRPDKFGSATARKNVAFALVSEALSECSSDGGDVAEETYDVDRAAVRAENASLAERRSENGGPPAVQRALVQVIAELESVLKDLFDDTVVEARPIPSDVPA